MSIIVMIYIGMANRNICPCSISNQYNREIKEFVLYSAKKPFEACNFLLDNVNTFQVYTGTGMKCVHGPGGATCGIFGDSLESL